MKKQWILYVVCACICLILCGCNNTNADTLASPSPATSVLPSESAGMNQSPSVQPMASASPGTASGGTETTEQMQSASAALREALQKLSEVDTAVVVVAGNTALVGLTPDSQYQGTVDDRLKGMILTRAQTVSSAITEAIVTTDQNAVKMIEELYNSLSANESTTNIQSKVEQIRTSIGSTTTEQ